MAFDPELVAETRAWFARASNDLRAAEALIAASPALFDEAVFHCQQAAEKALKGFLTWNGRTFRKTHNLEEIGEQCLAVDPTLRDVIDQAMPLSEYAWKFRYPGAPFQPEADEVAEARYRPRSLRSYRKSFASRRATLNRLQPSRESPTKASSDLFRLRPW